MTGHLVRCEICGGFHFSAIPDALCIGCCIVVNDLRRRVEMGGGTVNVIDGTIKVRTKAQMRDPYEALNYGLEVREIVDGMRGGAQ